MTDHEDLRDEGIDFCGLAFTAAQSDQPLDPQHVATCPVCVRRRRMSEAEYFGIEPLDIAIFYEMIDQMADEYVGKPSGVDPFTARGFYAAMAADPEKEAYFARCVDALLNPVESTARFVDLTQARSEHTNHA